MFTSCARGFATGCKLTPRVTVWSTCGDCSPALRRVTLVSVARTNDATPGPAMALACATRHGGIPAASAVCGLRWRQASFWGSLVPELHGKRLTRGIFGCLRNQESCCCLRHLPCLRIAISPVRQFVERSYPHAAVWTRVWASCVSPRCCIRTQRTRCSGSLFLVNACAMAAAGDSWPCAAPIRLRWGNPQPADRLRRWAASGLR